MGDLDRTFLEHEMAGNDFIRSLVNLMFEEARIIGDGKFMEQNHEKIINLKYPNEIEVTSRECLLV